MERQSLLSLTTQIDYTFRVKLEPKNVFVVCFKFCFLKGLEEPIEQKEIVILWVVRHDNQERYYSEKDIVNLLIRLSLSISNFCNAGLDQRSSLRDEIICQGDLTKEHI